MGQSMMVTVPARSSIFAQQALIANGPTYGQCVRAFARTHSNDSVDDRFDMIRHSMIRFVRFDSIRSDSFD